MSLGSNGLLSIKTFYFFPCCCVTWNPIHEIWNGGLLALIGSCGTVATEEQKGMLLVITDLQNAHHDYWQCVSMCLSMHKCTGWCTVSISMAVSCTTTHCGIPSTADRATCIRGDRQVQIFALLATDECWDLEVLYVYICTKAVYATFATGTRGDYQTLTV